MAFLQRLFMNPDDFNYDPKRNTSRGFSATCYIVTKKRDYNQEQSDDDEICMSLQNDPIDTEYCAKVFRQKTFMQEQLLNEALILKNANHPAILEYRGFNFYDFNGNPNPTILTLYMKNGSLSNQINQQSAEFSKTKEQICIIGIASAMKYIHQKGIIHRDLKLENVLLDDNFYPKICDFGFAKRIGRDSRSNEVVGTLYFMAPEIVNGGQYSFEVDVYAFGVVLYILLSKKSNPYPNCDSSDVVEGVKSGKRPSFEGLRIKSSFQKLISECWKQNPADRPTFKQIYEELIDIYRREEDSEIDRDEVNRYIEQLSQYDINSAGKKILSISESVAASSLLQEDGANDISLEDALANTNNNIDFKTRFTIFKRNVSPFINSGKYFHLTRIINCLYDEVASFSGSSDDKSALCVKVNDFLKDIFKEVKFQGQTSISKEDLKYLNEIDHVNISPSVVEILPNAFEGKKVHFINIRPSLKRIGKDAFKGCKELLFVNLTNNEMHDINEGTFENCTRLAYVRLPPNLVNIKAKAFRGCSSLKFIELPETLQSIESGAFSDCSKLESVSINAKSGFFKSQFKDSNVFPKSVKIYVK